MQGSQKDLTKITDEVSQVEALAKENVISTEDSNKAVKEINHALKSINSNVGSVAELVNVLNEDSQEISSALTAITAIAEIKSAVVIGFGK